MRKQVVVPVDANQFFGKLDPNQPREKYLKEIITQCSRDHRMVLDLSLLGKGGEASVYNIDIVNQDCVMKMPHGGNIPSAMEET